ncbi:MAG: hypothetical protein ACRDAM_13965 [Casimicrobium sp.]
MKNMIEITGANLIDCVKAAYDLSRPQGMGILHFTPEPLTDEEAQTFIQPEPNRSAISMDYVKGRACKFDVHRDENGRLWIYDAWFDHSHYELEELLNRIGVKKPEPANA